jgi:hypothetical protein
MTLVLQKVNFKLCPGNPLIHHVHIIRKKTRPTVYLTLPIGNSGVINPTLTNSLIAISNPLIANYLLKKFGEDIYELDEVPLFIPRHISEIMGMPLATILSTYCELDTKKQVWNIHHYTGPSLPTQIYKQHMVTPVDFQ